MMKDARNVAARFRDCISRIPGWNAGGGTQSASIAGLSGYASDAAVALSVSVKILTGLGSRDPHPKLGDDGYANDVRVDAMDALDWFERWTMWRNSNNWAPTRSIRVGDPIPQCQHIHLEQWVQPVAKER